MLLELGDSDILAEQKVVACYKITNIINYP